MRILLLTDPEEDYLQDSLLYGLRRVLGRDLVDHPRKDVMYASSGRPKAELYGRGFTLWKLLADVDVDREGGNDPRRAEREFDLILFGNVRRQKQLFRRWFEGSLGRRLKRRARYAMLDGQDTTQVYLPALARGPYFKRERVLGTAPWTRPISFSIPLAHVVAEVPAKDRLFATHAVCEEAYRLPWIKENCRLKYAFSDEAEYRDDLRRSHFGLTMRKAGWDCMRHYEIAANGSVPCFWRLDGKNRFAAPFDLQDGENCVAFDTAEELEHKTTRLLESGGYGRVARGAIDWARRYSCEALAERFVARFRG